MFLHRFSIQLTLAHFFQKLCKKEQGFYKNFQDNILNHVYQIKERKEVVSGQYILWHYKDKTRRFRMSGLNQ